MRFFFVLLIFSPFCLSAQRNFKPGYLIYPQGDTIKGFVDQQEWDRTPTTVLFSSTANGIDAKTYSVVNSAGFGITGGPRFRRYPVSISQDAVELYDLNDRDTTTKTATVFLQLVTEGNLLSLYTYADAIKRRFYIQEAGNVAPVELIYREYLLAKDRTKVRKDEVFRGQLKGVMYAVNRYSEKLAGQIELTMYEAGGLSKVVQAINKSTMAQKNGRKSYRFFVGAGLQRSTMEFAGDQFLAKNSTTTSDVQPAFSAGIDLLPNPDIGRIVVRFEFGYRTNNSTTIGSSGNNTRSTYTLKTSAASVSPQFIYNVYNTGQLKLYAGGGLSYNLLSYNTNQLNEYYISQNMQGPVKENYFKVNKSVFNFLLRAGVVLYNRVELSAILQPPSSLTNFGNYSVSMGFQQLHLIYRFVGSK